MSKYKMVLLSNGGFSVLFSLSHSLSHSLTCVSFVFCLPKPSFSYNLDASWRPKEENVGTAAPKFNKKLARFASETIKWDLL